MQHAEEGAASMVRWCIREQAGLLADLLLICRGRRLPERASSEVGKQAAHEGFLVAADVKAQLLQLLLQLALGQLAQGGFGGNRC